VGARSLDYWHLGTSDRNHLSTSPGLDLQTAPAAFGVVHRRFAEAVIDQ
jgi:hypothetical protein